mmetsp:Transcript_122292/g.351313  ORF Transcript_122292/g.351313 Transcript_122292/m.351313 type:complete len:222 (-) Transcript_122292:1079-1744(-)
MSSSGTEAGTPLEYRCFASSRSAMSASASIRIASISSGVTPAAFACWHASSNSSASAHVATILRFSRQKIFLASSRASLSSLAGTPASAALRQAMSIHFESLLFFASRTSSMRSMRKAFVRPASTSWALTPAASASLHARSMAARSSDLSAVASAFDAAARAFAAAELAPAPAPELDERAAPRARQTSLWPTGSCFEDISPAFDPGSWNSKKSMPPSTFAT